MPATSDAERVRTWVEENVIQPAKARGQKVFTVTAGDVHRDLGLKNRVPLVCQALKSKRLLDKNHLVLKEVSGPPSGLSTTLKITYEISTAGENAQAPNPFWGLRGIAKDVFRQLGGGENFIRQERENLSAATDSWQRSEGDAGTKFERVWRSITTHAGEGFRTVKGLPFCYRLAGDSVWIERDGRAINRVLAKSEFQKAWKRLPVSGPGELQDLQGPSYVFAILNDPRVREN
jgi:hypothetical protein